MKPMINQCFREKVLSETQLTILLIAFLKFFRKYETFDIIDAIFKRLRKKSSRIHVSLLIFVKIINFVAFRLLKKKKLPYSIALEMKILRGIHIKKYCIHI